MLFYNAGIFTSNFDKAGRVYSRLDEAEKLMRDSNTHFLESYHYINKPGAIKRIRNEGVKVFLDSGAFSAFSLGATIDLDTYCKYIQTNTDIVDFPSVLDSIGDYKGTWHNQFGMEANGVSALPCYHFGEPEEVLEYYIENYPYVTIGGLVPVSVKQKTIWLDRIWDKYLTNENGQSKIKIHAFGLTSLVLARRYPWYSVDSSTWVQWAANGMILLPRIGKQINVSNKSSARKIQGQHIDSISIAEKKLLEKLIRNEGIDPNRLRELYFSRWAWNSWAFPKFFELNPPPKTFKSNYEELF